MSKIICSVLVFTFWQTAHIYRCVSNGLCMRVLCGLRHLDPTWKSVIACVHFIKDR